MLVFCVKEKIKLAVRVRALSEVDWKELCVIGDSGGFIAAYLEVSAGRTLSSLVTCVVVQIHNWKLRHWGDYPSLAP